MRIIGRAREAQTRRELRARRRLPLLPVLALLFSLLACGQGGTDEVASEGGAQDAQELIPVKFGIPAMSAFYLPELLGIEKGIFAEEGIDLQVQVAAPPTLVAGAMSGDIPYNGATPTAVQARLVSGTPLTVVLSTFGLPMFELFAQKDIKDLKALAGKSVAVTSPNSSDQYVLQAQLDELGADYSKYSFVATGGSDVRYKALTSGSVAAAMLPPPFNQMAAKQGYSQLTRNEAARAIAGSGLAVSEAYLAENEDEIKRMIRAELRSMQYIRDNKSEAIAVMTSKLGMDPSVGDAAYETMVESMTADGRVSMEDLEAQAEQIRKTVGGKAASASSAGLTDYSLLEAVLQEND